MRARSALGALQIIAIGVVSAVAVFVFHRAFISGPGVPMSSGRSAAPPEPVTQFDPTEAPLLPQPTARGERELLAQTEPARNEGEAESPAGGRVPERRSRDVPNPHVAALRNPSPIYRNVSLTTVIREAGYACTDILSSTAGDDSLGTWRVSCEDARAYLISEDGTGDLRVEPIAYFEVPVRYPARFVPEPLNAPPLLPAPR